MRHPFISFDLILKVINYGEKLLASLPPEVRKSVFVGLTDLKSIMWFRVTRTAGGAYVYEKGAETTEVAASLCGLLGLSPEQVNDFDSGGNLPYQPLRQRQNPSPLKIWMSTSSIGAPPSG